MRCPACNTDNPPGAAACQSCRGSLAGFGSGSGSGSGRRRRRNDSLAEADSPQSLEYNRQVKGIFKLCLVSMVPFLGLVLGPLGAARAWLLLRRARSDPAFTAEKAAQVAVLLGTLTGVTQWLGLALITLGVFLQH